MSLFVLPAAADAKLEVNGDGIVTDCRGESKRDVRNRTDSGSSNLACGQLSEQGGSLV